MTEYKPDANELLFQRLDNMIPMASEMFDDIAQYALDNPQFHERVKQAHFQLKCARHIARMAHAQTAKG